MKPIKIIADNYAAIEDALRAVNGKADTHTYTSAISIMEIVSTAENKLAKLGIPKKERNGATYQSVSGSRLPSAYKYAARATLVEVRRNTIGWVLSRVAESCLYPNTTPHEYMTLTAKQDEIAVANLRKGYLIAKES